MEHNLETIFFAVIAVLVLGRLYMVLGQHGDVPPRLNDIGGDAVRPNGGAFGLNFDERKPEPARLPETFGNIDEMLRSQWGDLADKIIEIRKKETGFDPIRFQEDATRAYETIIHAFGKNEKEILRPLLSDRVFEAFASEIDVRIANDRKPIDILRLEEPKILEIHIANEKTANIDVLFKSSLSATNEAVRSSSEVWTFEKELGSRTAVWKLVAVEAK